MRIIHFHNGSGGGVLSVIKNLLQYSTGPEIENHLIYVINKEQQPSYNAIQLAGALSSTVFYYSPKWNFYHTCKRLAALIPDDKCVLVAHDWLELGMISQLGLLNPVIQFVHGDYDYYYKLAIKHEASVNAFICVSMAICEKLKKQLPERTNVIAYLHLPVPDVSPALNKEPGNRIVFIGRCEKEKGYYLLPFIEKELQLTNHKFEWHIYGEGSFDQEKQAIWLPESKVYFYGVVPGDQLLRTLPGYDFLVLPTSAEGMPVTVIEAMKAGIVPVVNHLPGGLEELIGDNERGFLVEQNKAENYANVLIQLQNQPQHRSKLAGAASLFAQKEFNAVKCTKVIEEFIASYARTKKNTKAKKVYGSRLDQTWLPNSIVYLLRSLAPSSKNKKG